MYRETRQMALGKQYYIFRMTQVRHVMSMISSQQIVHIKEMEVFILYTLDEAWL